MDIKKLIDAMTFDERSIARCILTGEPTEYERRDWIDGNFVAAIRSYRSRMCCDLATARTELRKSV